MCITTLSFWTMIFKLSFFLDLILQFNRHGKFLVIFVLLALFNHKDFSATFIKNLHVFCGNKLAVRWNFTIKLLIFKLVNTITFLKLFQQLGFFIRNIVYLQMNRNSAIAFLLRLFLFSFELSLDRLSAWISKTKV